MASVIVNTEPKTCGSSDMIHNGIEAKVDYSKQYGGIVLSLSAGKYEPGENFSGFQVAIFSSPSKYIVLTPTARDNKKKVAEAKEITLSQIQDKIGAGWDFVQAFAKEFELTII